MTSVSGRKETRLEQNMAGQTDFYEGRPDMERGERLAAFIESMEAAAPPFLRELEKEALAEGIPIIRPRTQGLSDGSLGAGRLPDHHHGENAGPDLSGPGQFPQIRG